MAIPFLNNIDLSDNQLLNAKLQVTFPAPTAAAGQIYYNSLYNTAQYYNGTAWVELVASTGGTVTSVTSGDTNTITIGGTATDPTVAANTAAVTDGSLNLVTGDQVYNFVTGSGYVESVGIGNSTFVSIVDSGTSIDPVLTASLSATGTPGITNFLRGDNTWATPINTNTTYDLDSIQVGSDVAITLVGSDVTTDTVTLVAGTNITLTDNGSANITIDASNPDQTVTLTGDVTGTGTTSIATTISAGAVDFAMINPAVVITEAEGIVNNDNDVTLPTSAAVKAYVDDSVAGGLVYQGGYNAATNTPNLDSPPTGAVNKGFTYTVTADGLFFTEQVRVGDVLIAEIDTPTTLADWTTVQNNIDLADLTTVGIGNVNAGTGISVAYSNGTATVTNTQTNSDNTYAVTITDTATITHGLGTKDVIIQLYDVTTDETVYADVDRASTATATITFATTPTNSVRVLVQKIG